MRAWFGRVELWVLGAALVSLGAGVGRGGLWVAEESGGLARSLVAGSEGMTRAPGILSAMVAALVLAWAVARTADGRAGAWVGVAYATLPMVFLDARLACGAWLAQSTGTLVFALGIAAVWGRGGRAWRAAGLAVGVSAGLAAARMGGAVAGAAAAGLLGCALAVVLQWREQGAAERWAGGLLGVVGLVSGVCWVGATGHGGAGIAGFDAVAERVGHGLLYWAPAVLMGAGRLLTGPVRAESAESELAQAREGAVRAAALGALAVAYAGQTWAAWRAGGEVTAWLAPGPLALSAGFFVRDFERARRPWQLAAVVSALGVAVMIRDVLLFPRAALGSLAGSLPGELPDASALGRWLAAAGGVFALASVAGLAGTAGTVRALRWAGRMARGLPFGVNVSSGRRGAGWWLPCGAVLAAGLMMHGYLPALSDRVSPGPAWRALERVPRAGDAVAVLGMDAGALGARFYAGGARAAGNAEQAVGWLRAAGGGARRFLVAPVGDLAALNRAYRAASGENLPLLATGPSGAVVAGPRTLPSANPLDAVVARAAPEPAAGATFDDALQLQGADISPGNARVRAGGSLDVTLRLRVLRAVSADWRTFVHVDGPCPRINADHDGASGIYPIGYWLPGDLVRDRFRVTVPWHCGAGEYTVYVGFFRGDARMRARGGENDGADRVVAARVRVD